MAWDENKSYWSNRNESYWSNKNRSYADTLQGRINNYETRFNAIGADIPPPKDNKSWLLKALDVIDTPRNAIVNAIQDSKTGENSAWQGFKEGGTLNLNKREHAYVSDLLDPNMNKYVRGGLGFVGDVLLDPLTYLTVGTGAAAKTALKEGGKAVAKEGANKHLKFMGQELIDLTAAGQKLGDSSLGRATEPLRQGVTDTFAPIFNTRHVMGKGKMSPEELGAIQGVVDDITYYPNALRGNSK